MKQIIKVEVKVRVIETQFTINNVLIGYLWNLGGKFRCLVKKDKISENEFDERYFYSRDQGTDWIINCITAYFEYVGIPIEFKYRNIT